MNVTQTVAELLQLEDFQSGWTLTLTCQKLLMFYFVDAEYLCQISWKLDLYFQEITTNVAKQTNQQACSQNQPTRMFTIPHAPT